MRTKGLAALFLAALIFFPLCMLYKYREKKTDGYYLPVSIQLISPNAPYLGVEIGDQKFSAKLDLGSTSAVKVTSAILQAIPDKTFIATRSTFGWKGKKYPDKVFQVPEIKIGRASIHSVCLHEESPEFLQDAALNYTDIDLEFGRLGWKLFNKTKLFLNLGSSEMVLCDSAKTLKQHGCHLTDFSKVPLLLDHDLLEIMANTPNGPIRCLLDTGSTWNLLHSEDLNDKSIEEILDEKNVVEIKSFHIGKQDFGTVTFHKLPITPPFPIQAILGMDFFMEHQVFLDFENKEAYIAKTKPKTNQ